MVSGVDERCVRREQDLDRQHAGNGGGNAVRLANRRDNEFVDPEAWVHVRLDNWSTISLASYLMIITGRGRVIFTTNVILISMFCQSL